jgi:hypothetical protein
MAQAPKTTQSQNRGSPSLASPRWAGVFRIAVSLINNRDGVFCCSVCAISTLKLFLMHARNSSSHRHVVRPAKYLNGDDARPRNRGDTLVVGFPVLCHI